MVALVAFATANRSLWFELLDPAGTQERQQEQALLAIGSAENSLSVTEALQLFDRFNAGEYTASIALVHQDVQHGLPEKFIESLEYTLINEQDKRRNAISLIERLSLHRLFGESVELALADTVRSPGGSSRALPISALGNMGVHRPLTDSTLTLLLELAIARSSIDRSALAAVEKTARPFGLPDWALDRLEEITEQRPGQVRNDAIRVLAAAGAKERARRIVNLSTPTPTDPETIAEALAGSELISLLDILEDDSQAMDLRIGALTQIVKRRDESELVGRALAYAFESDEAELRLAAFNTFSEWGRHHSSHINVSWHRVIARAFSDDNQAIRSRAASVFHFVSFADNQERDRFLLDMLLMPQQSDVQRLSALQAISRTRLLSEPVIAAVVSLTDSDNPDIAATAGVLAERYRPKGIFYGLGDWLAGALFWILLAVPAVTALAFQTYFVARLLQRIADGGPRVGLIVVSALWFFTSLGLGMLLFVGALAMGHGGGSDLEVFFILIAIDAVFIAIGWILNLAVRPATCTPAASESRR